MDVNIDLFVSVGNKINERDYLKKFVEREFVDHNNGMAGFFWRARYG